jgi:hypothetical protein
LNLILKGRLMIKESDKINISKTFDNASEEDATTHVDELRQVLQIDPYGITRKRFDTVVNLTALGATSQIALAIPAGAVVQYVGARILTTVVASSTTAAIGIGSSGTVSKYGFTTSLLAGQTIATCWGTVSAGENIGVVANISGGGTIGGGNITAGSVHLRVIYDVPLTLTS